MPNSAHESEIPEAGAIAIRGRKGIRQVLLVRAKKDPSKWIFPKGHIEAGETPAMAAQRELREESGYEGKALTSVGVSEFQSGDETVRVEYFLIDVPAHATRGDSESREQRWCTYDEALKLLSFDDARDLLRKTFEQRTDLRP